MILRFGLSALNKIEIVSYSDHYLPEMWELWKTQYQAEFSTATVMPETSVKSKREVEAFLKKGADSRFVAVARKESEVVGYMFFQVFPFHGDLTAFCPIIAHAETKEIRRTVFEKLYSHLSAALFDRGIRNHVVTYFAHDEALDSTVFALGFGMIVIDAFRDTQSISSRADSFGITKATPNETHALEVLGEKSREYYLDAPIFLNRDKESKQYYRDLLSRDDMAIYIASIDGNQVGFMSVRRNKDLRFIDLCDPSTAMIDKIGAYIEPEYRRRGIGTCLLSRCVEWCRLNGMRRIHVDFESANVPGRSFWLEFFTETMRSAKRTVHKDVLTGQRNMKQE